VNYEKDAFFMKHRVCRRIHSVRQTPSICWSFWVCAI